MSKRPEGGTRAIPPQGDYPSIDFDDDFVSGNEVVQAGLTWPGITYAFASFDWLKSPTDSRPQRR